VGRGRQQQAESGKLKAERRERASNDSLFDGKLPIVDILTLIQIMKALVKKLLTGLGYKVTKIPKGHFSETSRCRPRLSQYCVGNGVDLGFGGEAITPSAVRIDYPRPYSRGLGQPVQLGGDCRRLEWFRDECLDYVYSSHLLEDFEDTEGALKEWLRVLKPGGYLVLFCPDEQVFRRHCEATGQRYNEHHQHADFSLEKVKMILARLGQRDIVHQLPLTDDYSWDLVVRKT
jgi:predicted SAM-dependent methyltransferase